MAEDSETCMCWRTHAAVNDGVNCLLVVSVNVEELDDRSSLLKVPLQSLC